MFDGAIFDSAIFDTGAVVTQQPAGAPSKRHVIVRGKHYHVTPQELSELLYFDSAPDAPEAEIVEHGDAPAPEAVKAPQKAVQASTQALLAELSAFGDIVADLQAAEDLGAAFIAQVRRQMQLAEESAVIAQIMLELA